MTWGEASSPLCLLCALNATSCPFQAEGFPPPLPHPGSQQVPVPVCSLGVSVVPKKAKQAWDVRLPEAS